jgi:hypothetical protein
LKEDKTKITSQKNLLKTGEGFLTLYAVGLPAIEEMSWQVCHAIRFTFSKQLQNCS